MEVVVFTMKGCPHCDELKKILVEKKITFTEKDVDDNEEIYNKFSKAVDSEYLPAILIGRKAFLAERSYKTIKQAGNIIQNFLLEQEHRGHHLG